MTEPGIFAAFLWPGGHHHAAWRLESSRSDEMHSLALYAEMAHDAERGCFDVLFLGDLLAVWPVPGPILAQTARAARIEPLTMLAALAALTSTSALVGTMSTTFDEPVNVARRMGSLDHISGGRAGWNVVRRSPTIRRATSGMDVLPPRPERYARAQEFIDVVKALWDSYEDDAILRDKASGQYFDEAKLHRLDQSASTSRSPGRSTWNVRRRVIR